MSPRSCPPKSGYSFASVLKQCGQLATIFVTPASFSVETFCSAKAWKTYSFPARRAGSPVHDSRGPRIATSSPAASSSFAVDSARGPRALVEGGRAAHPVEDLRRRVARLEDADPRVPRPRRRARVCGLPHGFDARSTSRSIVSVSAGRRESTITRLRRRSTMWSTCSIETGHSCTHAPQVTQSQTTSSVTAAGTSASRLPRRALPARPRRAGRGSP